MFRRSVERLEKLQTAYGARAAFLTIFIKNAHATDVNPSDENARDGVCYMTPKTLTQRLAIASDFLARQTYSIPLVVDEMDDDAMRLYAAFPERLYVIDELGRVAFQSPEGAVDATAALGAWLAQRFPEPPPN